MNVWKEVLDCKDPERLDAGDMQQLAVMQGYRFFAFEGKVYEAPSSLPRPTLETTENPPNIKDTGRTVEECMMPDVFCVTNQEGTHVLRDQRIGEPMLFTNGGNAQLLAERTGGKVALWGPAFHVLRKAAAEGPGLIIPAR